MKRADHSLTAGLIGKHPGRSFRQLLQRIVPAVGLMLLLAGSPFALGQTPEYIISEKPIPKSLKDTISATERIGVVPTSRPLDAMLAPGLVLPELRKKIPTTGYPFLDDIIYHVSPRSYYRYTDHGDRISEAFTYGGEVGLETGYLADFLRIGVTGFTSQKIHAPSDRGGSGLLALGQEAYTVLGEAYVDLKFRDTHAVLYRQRLDLPYININDSRMTPNTFEAYGIHSKAIPNLQVAAGQVQKIKFRTSSDFESLSSFAGAPGTDKGVTVVGGRYEFTERFHLGMVEEYGWDTFSTFYAESDLLIPLSDEWSLKAGLQFTDQRSVGAEWLGQFEGQHAGGKIALEYKKIILSSAYTWTSNGHSIRNPWGGSPSYNSVMISNFDRAGENAVRLNLSRDFSDIGLEGFAASLTWLHGDTPDGGADATPDQEEFNINLDYRPSMRGFDNVWLRVRYAINERDASLGGRDREDLRVILNYSFSF